MAYSLLFPAHRDLSQSEHDLLSQAYEIACNRLIEEHGYSSQQLSDTIEDTASALVQMFEAGLRDVELLGRCAALQVHDALRKRTATKLRSLQDGPRR